MKIPLMKSTFFEEEKTKRALCEFIMKSKQLSMGDEVKKFEENFAKEQKRKYAIMVNSGSSANLLLLSALKELGKLKSNDRIGFSAITWATNVMPITQLNFKAIPVDVELDTLNVSSKKFKEALSHNIINAFFITNLLGFCDDIDEIQRICIDNNIILLEDNCESLGSIHQGKLLGNFSLASTFSFFVGHHMSTIEGGMVCTDDEEVYHALLMCRAHGWDRQLPNSARDKLRKEHDITDFYGKYAFYVDGYNLRPMEIQGFIGNSQIGYMENIHGIREGIFQRYDSAAKSNPNIEKLDLNHMDRVSNFAYPIVMKDKEGQENAVKLFAENGVEVRPIVGGSMVEQPFYKKKNINLEYSCPNAKKIHQTGFYIPNNPELTDEEVAHLINLIKRL